MRAEKAGKFIINKLGKELPPYLSYHNTTHVRDVHDAAMRIGIGESISEGQMDLLLTAAWYHDAGFMITPNEHEEESCLIAAAVLPGFGYTKSEIESIQGMIRATRLPQSPQNHLEQILADADLDYLGRNDFFKIGDCLYQELKHLGSVDNPISWDKMQVAFLQQHKYLTKTAINTRQQKKEANLATIKARLNIK